MWLCWEPALCVEGKGKRGVGCRKAAVTCITSLPARALQDTQRTHYASNTADRFRVPLKWGGSQGMHQALHQTYLAECACLSCMCCSWPAAAMARGSACMKWRSGKMACEWSRSCCCCRISPSAHAPSSTHLSSSSSSNVSSSSRASSSSSSTALG